MRTGMRAVITTTPPSVNLADASAVGLVTWYWWTADRHGGMDAADAFEGYIRQQIAAIAGDNRTVYDPQPFLHFPPAS